MKRHTVVGINQRLRLPIAPAPALPTFAPARPTEGHAALLARPIASLPPVPSRTVDPRTHVSGLIALAVLGGRVVRA